VRIALRHRMVYRFDRAVRLSTHWLRLRPAPMNRARIQAYSLRVEAEPHFLNWVRDPFENHLARLDLPEPMMRLGLDVEILAELAPVNPFDFLLDDDVVRYPFEYRAPLRRELAPYLAQRTAGPLLERWLARLDRGAAGTIEVLSRTTRAISESLPVHASMRPGAVDAEAVLAHGEANPWALAWLATLGMRSLGLAARFVSGYYIKLGAEGAAPDAAQHAWSEVFLPGAGWVGVDPTSGMFAAEAHIALAAATDPVRALPVVGYCESCRETQHVAVTAHKLEPRAPDWPLSERQWSDVCAAGQRVDAGVERAQLELTCAAAVNFVASEAHDAPEWNTTALGADKRQAAERMSERLHAEIAPGGVVQEGQSAWFAGEPAPRWRLSLVRRRDGNPVWRERRWLAGFGDAASSTAADAHAFGKALARALGVDSACLLPAYEDAAPSQLGATGPLPDAARLRDPEQRRLLLQRVLQGEADLRGYVMPLHWDPVAACWRSGRWRLRRDAVYLLAGSAPMGYRLPLDSLPAAAGELAPEPAERCPLDALTPLGEVHAAVNARLARDDAGASSAGAPRTALCIELRAGVLHVFLPPLTHLEYYLDLVACIEHSAAQCGVPVRIEGYGPPDDPRLDRFDLEPDAGVLRVQLPAMDSWRAQSVLLEAVYGHARAVGLQAARVTGSGGRQPPGAVTPLALGGSSPAQSPFLRRPALIGSLIAYWHRHPSLSYFFSGRSIGRGGNAPRPDEGRDDALYELELVLRRLPDDASDTPWLADRLLRHLLTDAAGDMHRAEFDVDALYSPGRAAKRQGRIVLRTLQAPPSARLTALQILLVHALLMRFAQIPERGPLESWGAALHDRFLLPRLLWQDLAAVLEDVRAVGVPMDPAWFEPLLDVHFPLLGSMHFANLDIDLRQAHEPWPVLSEEASGGGMARFLDSAADRVEVRCMGLTPSRHVLECNGLRVPLQPTGVRGEFVAGIRFKAWNPPATLHPTVEPVDALVLNMIDSWSGRLLGGCTYLPAVPALAGPASVPEPEPGVPGVGGPPPRRAQPVVPATQARAGVFIPHGAAAVPAVREQRAVERPYLLDLVQPGGGR